jgi:hypothetical protein
MVVWVLLPVKVALLFLSVKYFTLYHKFIKKNCRFEKNREINPLIKYRLRIQVDN